MSRRSCHPRVAHDDSGRASGTSCRGEQCNVAAEAVTEQGGRLGNDLVHEGDYVVRKVLEGLPPRRTPGVPMPAEIRREEMDTPGKLEQNVLVGSPARATPV